MPYLNKPRAYEGAMGIESMAPDGEERRVPGTVGVGARCVLLSADMLRGWSQCREESAT